MASRPFVSIILPVRNEAASIERCLNAILAQDYPQEQMEILVVDGMSTDGTRELVEEYPKTHSNIRLVDNPGRIVPTGMNIAIRMTRGDILIRVDGHCIIAPDYVTNCVKHLTGEAVDGVGGSMETVGETRLAQTIAIAMSSRFGVGNSAFRTVNGRTMLVDTVPFPAYTRAIVLRAGWYDEELVRNQDDEYNYRIREMGGRLLLAADVHSRYFSRGTLRQLWKQYFQYGVYKVRVLQKHPRQMSLRQFVPPLFTAGLVGSAVAGVFFPLFRYFFGGLIALYLVVNLTFSLITSTRKGWGHFGALPAAYAILHLGYGSGFWAGLYKFRSRW